MALGLSDGVRDLPDFLEWGTFGVMFFGIPILACMGLFALMMFALQIRSASIVIAFGAATSFAILAAGVAPKGDFVNWVYRDISEIMGSIGAGAISAWLYWLTALHRPSTKTDDGAASP
ncbi:hypothetical protein [Microvirga lotononidis]|nr:hypothetical protein [Microvirga lotononidis]WQO29215.1 hypothetical protein U0023_09180 [Microvirga lotononidis]